MCLSQCNSFPLLDARCLTFSCSYFYSSLQAVEEAVRGDGVGDGEHGAGDPLFEMERNALETLIDGSASEDTKKNYCLGLFKSEAAFGTTMFMREEFHYVQSKDGGLVVLQGLIRFRHLECEDFDTIAVPVPKYRSKTYTLLLYDW